MFIFFIANQHLTTVPTPPSDPAGRKAWGLIMGITNMSEDTNESGSRVSNGKPYVTDITCVNYQRQIVHTSNAKEDITSLIFVSVSFRLSDGTTMDVLIGHDGLELACSPSKGFSECITWDAIHAAIKHRIPGDALILQPSD